MLFPTGVVCFDALTCLTLLADVRLFPLQPHRPAPATLGVPLLAFAVYSATRGTPRGRFRPPSDRRFEMRIDRKFTTAFLTEFISLTGDPHGPPSLSLGFL